VSLEFNYLVISDLHLGAGGERGALDRALVQFIDHYREQRPHDRPWRLIIAGDGIDFLHFGLDAPAEEKDHCEDRAVAALEAIVAANDAVFAALARFVGAKNELIFLKGNHDAELHWDRVQWRLRELLVERRPEGGGREDAETFAGRIAIHPWFYYREGLLYVEHGNQYDELCSFEHVLWPVGNDQRIIAPLSHVALQVFSRLVHRLDPHGVDRWTLGDFLRWIASLEPKLLWSSAASYFGCSAWLSRLKRRLSTGVEAAQTRHRARLRQVVDHFNLREEAVELIDRLRRRPAGTSLLRGFRMLFFDQLLLGLVTSALLVLLVSMDGAIGWRALAGGALVAIAAGLSSVWSKRRTCDPRPDLARNAERVAELLEVPFVVFGHSHVPEVRSVAAERATYVNTGSWTHEGESGLTHLMLAPGGGAELRRWNAITARPDAVTPCRAGA
jgi:UDP-2,3-diacylglucosamine pyrophosphatase LpxH